MVARTELNATREKISCVIGGFIIASAKKQEILNSCKKKPFCLKACNLAKKQQANLKQTSKKRRIGEANEKRKKKLTNVILKVSTCVCRLLISRIITV